MDILVEKTITMKCTDLKVNASNNIEMEAGSNILMKSGTSTKINGGGLIEEKAGKITLN